MPLKEFKEMQQIEVQYLAAHDEATKAALLRNWEKAASVWVQSCIKDESPTATANEKDDG